MVGEYYNTKESVDEYIHAAAGHSGSQLIAKLKDFLPVGSVLLEIGSGPGTDWEILSKDYQVVGSDFSPEFLRRLREKFPKGEFMELDAATLATDHTFAGIYSNKVLHHLTDDALVTSFERQAALLKSGGVFCHSFWAGEGSEVFKGMFVNYHTEVGIRRCCESLFEVLLVESYPEFEDGDSLLVIGRKK